MPEVTEGTPVKPSGVTSFIPETADFSMNPNYDKTENAEQKNSLGKSKSIVTGESPDANITVYLKHSGTSGTAPQYGEILKAAFGSENIDSDEETTDAGCTSAIVKLTADGAHHPRGSGLIINDTNGSTLRPVHSQSTQDLTLGFEMTAADAAITVGKSVTYIPTDSSQQTLTLWDYLGNGGALRMVKGARPTSLDISLTATELATMGVSFEGIGFYFNPVEIIAGNKNIDFTDDIGTVAASVPLGYYKDPHELGDAIATVMTAAGAASGADIYTCTYSDTTGVFTIVSDGTVLSILWKTGTSGADGTDTHVGTTIGFSDAADDTGALTYAADAAMDWSADYTPTFDTTDPIACKDMQVYMGEAADSDCFNPSSVSVTFGVPKADTMSLCAATGKSGSVVSSREVTIDVTALLPQYCADRFRRMRENSETRFFIGGGIKTGGNFTKGKCFGFYGPTCTIESIDISDNEGSAEMSVSLSTFVNSTGDGEFYMFNI